MYDEQKKIELLFLHVITTHTMPTHLCDLQEINDLIFSCSFETVNSV